MADHPVPEAAVEAPEEAVKAGGQAVSANYAYAASIPQRKHVFVEPEDMAYDVLKAALDTGTLIAVPQDEQGRRELIERVWSVFQWAGLKRDRIDTATRVLQALGLLPEQEEAEDCPECGAPAGYPPAGPCNTHAVRGRAQ